MKNGSREIRSIEVGGRTQNGRTVGGRTVIVEARKRPSPETRATAPKKRVGDGE